MPDFVIDPAARNPLYTEAVVLGDVNPDTQLVTFDTRKGDVSVTTIASDWRTEERPVVISAWDEETLISLPDLVANDTRGRELSLPKKGVHPFLGNGAWDSRHFSVIAARENILKFYFWLERQGYPRSANKLQDLFLDYFVVDWDQLLKRG